MVNIKLLLFYLLLETTETANIVNGFRKAVEPKRGAFPFQANLMQLLADKSFHSFCGGSLIHPRWVLTAAHCIQIDNSTEPLKPNEVYIALGSIFTSGKGGQIIRANDLKIHSNYLKSDTCDIGLIKLQKSAKLGRWVKVVKLHRNVKESLINRTAYLTGFGIINDFYETPLKLRKATLHISSNRKCFIRDTESGKEICATSTVREGKACKGDSGGPLTIIRNKQYIQIGITSHLAILPFCQIGFNHSVYTRVSYFIKWISKITGINFFRYNLK